MKHLAVQRQYAVDVAFAVTAGPHGLIRVVPPSPWPMYRLRDVARTLNKYTIPPHVLEQLPHLTTLAKTGRTCNHLHGRAGTQGADKDDHVHVQVAMMLRINAHSMHQ